MINPESIAFFGASNNFSSMGTNQLASTLALGYKGRVYPVHPKEDRVLGLKAFQRVADLPETPDLAVMVLPTAVVPDVMEACGQRGIPNAVVVSGGFNEVGGEGVRLQQELNRIARRYHMRFLGPNCLGIANPHHRLNTTFLPYEGEPGFVGMASQSGSFITQMFGYLSRKQLGFSTALSVGNEADIDIVDCLEYLAVCPRTRVICLYIEAIRQGRRFMEAAASITPHKPIVAYYVGGSESGKRASLSHTGALSGPDRLYGGAFQQSGIIRADSIQELFDFCAVLGTAPLPQGKRVVIQTHSGGPGAAAADACSREGLSLPLMNEQLKDKLAQFVPHTGSIGNPLDITFSKDQMEYFFDIPAHLLEGDMYDILLIYLLMPRHLITRALQRAGIPADRIEDQTSAIIDGICDSLKNLSEAAQKPVVGFTFHADEEAIVWKIRKRNIPVLTCPRRSARAIAALVRYAARCRHAVARS